MLCVLIVTNMRKKYQFLLVVAFFLYLQSCAKPCDMVVVNTVISPDGALGLLAVETGCGATTSDSINVYIVPKEQLLNPNLKKNNPIFTADKVKNIHFSWEKKNTVVINYSSARIFFFKNFWTKKIGGQYRTISIIEQHK